MLLGDPDVEDPVGKRVGEGAQTRPDCSMAAVIATMSARSRPTSTISSEKTPVQRRPGLRERPPGLRVDHADAVEAVGLVVLGRRVAQALVGERVHDDRPTEAPWHGARACSIAATSWPSIGPTYFRPRSSNMPCGATTSFSPFFMPCRVS